MTLKRGRVSVYCAAQGDNLKKRLPCRPKPGSARLPLFCQFKVMVHSLHTTPAPEWPYYRYIKERQASSICGYVDGKSDSPILVPSGYVCSTDKSSAQFGICSTSGDGCHFPAACFDAHSCSDGCGQTNYRTIIEWYADRPQTSTPKTYTDSMQSRRSAFHL